MKSHPIYTRISFDEDGNMFKDGKLIPGTKLRCYRRVKFSHEGKLLQKLSHRLIYETFYGSIPKGLIVMHHDEWLPEPYLNAPFNLFLGTTSINALDTYYKGRIPKWGTSSGDANGMRNRLAA